MILLSIILSIFIIITSYVIEKYLIYSYNIKKIDFLNIKSKYFTKFACFNYIDSNEENEIIDIYIKWFIKNHYNQLLLNIKQKDITNDFLLRDNYWYFIPDKDLKFYLGTLNEQSNFDFYDFVYNINVTKEEKKTNTQKHIYDICLTKNFEMLKFIFS